MQRTITPFRVTLILDADKSAVAQIERMETLTEDDGTVILSRALPAQPLEFPLSGELLGDLSAQAIARCKELDEQIETLTKNHAESLAAKDAEKEAAETSNTNAMTLLASRTLELESAQAKITEDSSTIETLTADLAAAKAETQGVYQFRDNLLAMLASGADPMEVAKEALGTLKDKRRAAGLAKIEDLAAQTNAIKVELGIE